MTNNAISSVKLSGSITKTYAGKDVPVTFADKELDKYLGLKQGTDYEIVSYSNNTKKGKKATVTICGIGSYGGTKTIKFTITAKKL